MTRDIEVLQKVCDTSDEQNWYELPFEDEYFQAIEFTEEIEKHINSYYTEPTNKLVIIVGTYKVRFYNEEDNFILETREYAAIVSKGNNNPINVYFTTAKELKERSRTWFIGDSVIFGKKTNLITTLYNQAKRSVSKVDELYDNFLD